MYNLKDIMTMFKIPERTIRRHIKEGLLSGTKVGGTWKFTQEDVETYIGKSKIQKHIKDEGLKIITDYYRGHVENKSDVVYMVIKDLHDPISINNFLKVTHQFANSFSMTCNYNGNNACFTFKGQPDDVLILMKWSEAYEENS